jgi:hypothetical protein
VPHWDNRSSISPVASQAQSARNTHLNPEDLQLAGADGYSQAQHSPRFKIELASFHSQVEG